MLIKLQFNSACTATTLLLITLSVQAAPDRDTPSPYLLNLEPVKISQVIAPTADPAANQFLHMYQLEYKYRAQTKPVKIKAALSVKNSENTTQLLSFRMSDSGNEIPISKQPFSNEIILAATAASLDPSLVHAIIYVESRYQHGALSAKGAVGLMQVLPDTAARYGLREVVHIPKDNIKAGTLYLRDLMVMFDNRLDLALAAYNAGEGAVKKYSGQIPPYPETRNYVKAVMARYAQNVGANQWRPLIQSENNTPALELLQKKPLHAKYLAGTDMEITRSLFTLNH